MEVDGVFGDAHGGGHQVHGVFDVEDALAVEDGHNLAVLHGHGDGGLGIHLEAGAGHRLLHQFGGVFPKGLDDPYRGRRRGGEGGQHLGKGGVQIKVDTEQADDPPVLPLDSDGGGLQRLPLAVLGKVGDGRGALLLGDAGQHGKGQVGDGGPHRAAGVVAVDDLHHRSLQVLQAVEDDLIAVPQVLGKAVQQVAVGLQYQPVGGGQHHVLVFHQRSHPSSVRYGPVCAASIITAARPDYNRGRRLAGIFIGDRFHRYPPGGYRFPLDFFRRMRYPCLIQSFRRRFTYDGPYHRYPQRHRHPTHPGDAPGHGRGPGGGRCLW